jgi:hypothetical protein
LVLLRLALGGAPRVVPNAEDVVSRAAEDVSVVREVGQNSTTVYYRVFGTTGVAHYHDLRRMLCLGCLKNHCRHVTQVERYLGITTRPGGRS